MRNNSMYDTLCFAIGKTLLDVIVMISGIVLIGAVIFMLPFYIFSDLDLLQSFALAIILTLLIHFLLNLSHVLFHIVRRLYKRTKTDD